MSTIRKERGIWTYYGRVGKKQVHRSLQTADRRIALDRKKLLDLELTKSTWINRRMSWEDFRTQYLAWSKARKPAGTYKNEKLAIERLAGVISPVLLVDITRERAEEFVTRIAGTLTPAGVNFYIRTLRSIFGVAVEWKLLQENPFRSVKLLKFDMPAPRILTRSEVAAIFRVMERQAPEYIPLIAFYLMTGMRRREALQLEWKDVTFESGVITVARSKGRRPRLIPMAPAARRILLSRKGERKPFDWYPDTVTRIFHGVCVKAGLPDVSLHDLRRTYGTLLAQSGVNALFIQKWMGHTDPEVTREHYIGLPEQTQKQLSSLRKILPRGV